MALLLRHRLPLPVPLLLAFLLAASSHGAPPGNESYDPSLCLWQPSTCGNLSIKYPFYLYGKTADILGNPISYCGYPGLAIQCEDDKAVLQVGGEKYNVSDIDYRNLTVSVVDSDVISDDDESCPRVDHNQTLPVWATSWLSYPNDTVDFLFFFVNCSLTNTEARQYNIDPITCNIFGGMMAGLLSFVLPWRDEWQNNQVWWQACQRVFKVPILRSFLPSNPSDYKWRDGGYGNALRTGFQLKWENKNSSCNQCEQSNGQCAYNQAGDFVTCLCSGGRVDAHKNCSSSEPYEASSGKLNNACYSELQIASANF